MRRDSPPELDPFVAAVDAIGDAWTFLISREAFFGARRFEDFRAGLRISSARLTERLKHLVALGLLERRCYEAARRRYEYRLTPKGVGIYPIALTMIEWGRRWRAAESDAQLVHACCGAVLDPVWVCRDCGEAVTAEDVRWPPILPLRQAMPDEVSVRGWRRIPNVASASLRRDPAIEVLSAVGDRWSMLIMYGALQREFQFREAQAKLGIAHNILSDRLKSLVEAGLLERADASRRAPYRSTPAGQGLLFSVLATRTWAMDHLVDPHRAWNRLVHEPCGADIRIDPQCRHCGETIRPQDISVRPAS